MTCGAIAAKRSRSYARRLGWLLELVRPDLDLRALREVADPDRGQPTLLSTKEPRHGTHDTRWGVRVNTTVEPDEL